MELFRVGQRRNVELETKAIQEGKDGEGYDSQDRRETNKADQKAAVESKTDIDIYASVTGSCMSPPATIAAPVGPLIWSCALHK